MSVLGVKDAHKSFGAVQAVKGISLELCAGEMLALLGPNGAGKTTLVRAISGRARLDKGEIDLLGKRLEAGDRREALGVVPQEIALYPLLTARENLEAFGALQGLRGAKLRERVAWALDWTALAERGREPIKRFSGGMKRRLNIACAVLHEPRVLLLDEPTVGVDPQSRERIYLMLQKLRETGTSILLTTHLLEEAELLCDRIVIMDHGQVVASGTLTELVDLTIGRYRRVTLRLDKTPRFGVEGCETGADGVTLTAQVLDVSEELPALLVRVGAAGCLVEDMEVRAPSLQSVFLHLTGRDLRE